MIMEGKLAAIRLRGENKIPARLEYAMQTLNLCKRHFCVIVPNSPTYNGMLAKTKDYITWGEIDDETFKLVESKRKNHNKKENSAIAIFRLNSPRKGYGRKGLKTQYQNGGALGYRGPKINELIQRMV